MAAATSSNLYPSFSSMYTMRRWIPVPVGMVMERQPSLRQSLSRLLCVPCSYRTEVGVGDAFRSDCFQHGAYDGIASRIPSGRDDRYGFMFFGGSIQVRRRSTIPVWISKLSTVLMPIARYSLHISLRCGSACKE